MKINFYTWRDTPDAVKQKIFKRSETDIDSVKATVTPIIEDVRKNGDEGACSICEEI